MSTSWTKRTGVSTAWTEAVREVSYLLLETGDKFLLETGGGFLLESATVGDTSWEERTKPTTSWAERTKP